MGLAIHHSFSPALVLQRAMHLVPQHFRCQQRYISMHRQWPIGSAAYRFRGFSAKCSVIDVSVDSSSMAMEDETSEDLPSCTDKSDIFYSTFMPVNEDVSLNSYNLSTVTFQVLTKVELDALAATPAHPGGLTALYASFLVGNVVEQMWNFTWPTAVATLHPSFLPVAVIGFFSKLSVFIGAPLVGNLLDHYPRIPAYHCLNIIQTAAQILSASMIIYALNIAPCTCASAIILQPWFVVLVAVGAVERLAGLALGVTVEREWVVMLAGANRPIALAHANAMLNRIDLLSELVGASVFGVLLSKCCTITCLKIACGLMICALPVLVFLGELVNMSSSGALQCSKICQKFDDSVRADSLLYIGKIVEKGLESIRNGWMEYIRQPILPASLAYVFLYFNIALAPGSIMTAFLMHHGVSPSIIGGFSGLSAFMGVTATFISATLVKKLGILKAAAAGLVFQSVLLAAAFAVLCAGSVSRKKPLLFFLLLIVLSRLGHMSYDVVGTQILQTGIPISKANLIGTTETSIASLAEFAMLAVAIIANDVRYFGFLALLSFFSVVGAATMFCYWLGNPSDEQRELFSIDPQF